MMIGWRKRWSRDNREAWPVDQWVGWNAEGELRHVNGICQKQGKKCKVEMVDELGKVKIGVQSLMMESEKE